MSSGIELLGTYLHLSRASQQRGQHIKRDRFLVLSAAFATRLGLDSFAAYCRKLVLEHNPGHMLGHWESVEHAITDANFLNFCRLLQRRYPLEKAEKLLHDLGIDGEGERDAYYSDEEYAAALLGTTPDEIARQAGTSDPND